jgi:hypothetical protein
MPTIVFTDAGCSKSCPNCGVNFTTATPDEMMAQHFSYASAAQDRMQGHCRTCQLAIRKGQTVSKVGRDERRAHRAKVAAWAQRVDAARAPKQDN